MNLETTRTRTRTEDKLALSIKEAVAVSGLSRSTIYNLLGSGDLPSVKIGTRRLIRRCELEALLEHGRGARAK
jgi:excisionase family DNA binding protein